MDGKGLEWRVPGLFEVAYRMCNGGIEEIRKIYQSISQPGIE
jgi:hypothetical protein